MHNSLCRLVYFVGCLYFWYVFHLPEDSSFIPTIFVLHPSEQREIFAYEPTLKSNNSRFWDYRILARLLRHFIPTPNPFWNLTGLFLIFSYLHDISFMAFRRSGHSLGRKGQGLSSAGKQKTKIKVAPKEGSKYLMRAWNSISIMTHTSPMKACWAAH